MKSILKEFKHFIIQTSMSKVDMLLFFMKPNFAINIIDTSTSKNQKNNALFIDMQ